MTIRLPLLAFVLSIFVAACGSDGSGGGSAESLGADELAQQADAICQEWNEKEPPPPPPQSAEEAREQARDEVRIRSEIRDELDQLEPPEELEDDFEEYQSKTGEIIEAVERQAENAGEDFREYQRATFELNTVTVQRGKVATRLGFEVCSQPTEIEQPLGDDELVSAADAACQEANEAILEATNPEGGGELDLEDASRFYEESFPAGQESLEALQEIEPPDSEADLWERFIAAYEERLEITERQKRAADSGDEQAFREATDEDTRVQAREADAALRLGLEVCGQNGTAGV